MTHLSSSQASTPPRVSLGLPVYNAQRYLPLALESVLRQDFTDFELIVSDNGSTDDTWAICQEYARRDPRIRLFRNKANLGVAANFNRVVHEARGELFRWVAYDDLMAPTLLSRCIAELDRSGPGTVLAYPQTAMIDDDGVVVEEYDDNLDIRHRSATLRVAAATRRWNLLNPLYGVIRLDQLRRTGLERPFVSGDVPLFLELAAMGEIHEVPERLFLRRFHADSSSGNSAAWYTPHRKGTESWPATRLLWRTLRALANSDHPAGTRAAVTAACAVTWGWRELHVTAGRCKAWARQSLQQRDLTWKGRRPRT
jgi:glycosyltransferase involved in cell wall biosynthesis